MRILVTGCGGMLGSAIYPTMLARGHEVRATDLIADETWLQYLDVRDTDTVKRQIEDFQPDAIYHLAAATDLEWCETHAREAYQTNGIATADVARLCHQYNLLMVYISTAGVFDGSKPTPYDENDQPLPLMVYGDSKLSGEKAVRYEHDRHFIVRAGWMFGGGRKDHKFVSKIAEQLIAGVDEIRAVNDKFGTVTYTKDFAANLDVLVGSQAYGTYHMVCEGSCTRYDVARHIVSVLGPSNVQVVPVASQDFEAEYFAPRPRSEMLVNRALKAARLNRMRFWKQAMTEYLTTAQFCTDRRPVLNALEAADVAGVAS